MGLLESLLWYAFLSSLGAQWLTLESSCSHRRPWHLSFCPLTTAQRGKGEYQDISHKGEGGGAGCHAHILQKFSAGLVKVTTSHRHQSSLTDFSVFLNMRRCRNWAHKIFSWKHLRAHSSSFPRAQSASLLSPPWAPLRGCCGLSAAVAHVLLHVEANGKCQTLVHSAPPWLWIWP